jgi:hypothetical protein
MLQLLSEYKLSYQILNAKPENVRRESEIVAQASRAKVRSRLQQIWQEEVLILFWEETLILKFKKLYDI